MKMSVWFIEVMIYLKSDEVKQVLQDSLIDGDGAWLENMTNVAPNDFAAKLDAAYDMYGIEYIKADFN